MAVRCVALIVALLTALAQAPQAWAHASLLKAEPTDGAVLALPPAALTLTFNEPVSPLVVRLIGPDGEPVPLGVIVAEDAKVAVNVPQNLNRGTHVLSWRVISADGHPVAGTVMFSIGAPSARPATAAQAPGDPSVRAGLWAVKIVIYVGLFIGVGGAFFRAWLADAPSSAAPWIAALIGGLVANVVSVGLQGLDALDLPLPALQQKATWQAGLATSYGLTAIASAFALFAGLFTLAAKSPRTARGFALVGLLGLGLALALSGHASAAAPWIINGPAVFLHSICAAFWIGSLLPLYTILRASPRAPRALAHFSRTIPLPVVLLGASGLWLACVQLGRVDALWTTSYGQVLIGKLAAVSALFALAAANRFWLVPRFEARGGAGARPLAMSIAFELVIALAILALVALWRFTPPPRALATAMPISLHIHGEKAMAEIEIENGLAARVELLDGAFRPLAAQEVTLVLANPAAGIEPMRRIAARTGESAWRVDDLRIPVAGRWNLRVEILISEFDKVTIEDTVALPRSP